MISRNSFRNSKVCGKTKIYCLLRFIPWNQFTIRFISENWKSSFHEIFKNNHDSTCDSKILWLSHHVISIVPGKSCSRLNFPKMFFTRSFVGFLGRFQQIYEFPHKNSQEVKDILRIVFVLVLSFTKIVSKHGTIFEFQFVHINHIWNPEPMFWNIHISEP